MALLLMGPWTGISFCVVVAQQPRSPEPTSAVEVAFPMAPSPAISQAMAACPEGSGSGPHVPASWARGLGMAALHCLAAEKPSPWAQSLARQVAAPCPSTSKLSRTALRMIHGAWLPMTRAALTWSLTMARRRGGDMSMGGVSGPGERRLLVTASSGNSHFRFPATEYPTGGQAAFQCELASSLPKDGSRSRPGVINIKLVPKPNAGSVPITCWPRRPRRQRLTSDDITSEDGVTPLKASDVSHPKSLPCTLAATQRPWSFLARPLILPSMPSPFMCVA